MSLIQKLMGRRQFLMATGLGAACAITCKKLAGFMDRNFSVTSAHAGEKGVSSGIKTAGNRCPHLLSPLRIRNVVLKNRIFHTVSPTYLMQGPENFPAEMYRNHYSNMAKNAGIVSMSTHYGPHPKTYVKGQHGPSANFCDDIWEDIPPVHNYVERLMEDIHCEGALILHAGATGGVGAVGMPGAIPAGIGAMQGRPSEGEGGPGAMPQGSPPGETLPGNMPGPKGPPPGSSMSVEEIVAEAREHEEKGYDVYLIKNSNIEALQAVRNSTSLVLMAELGIGMGPMRGGPDSPGVDNDNQPNADQLEQAVETARKLEGLADILWIRVQKHPNAWVQDKEKPFTLAYAEAIKKAGIKIITCPSAGFHDPVQNDQFIASGKTDMVGMTTPFFADAELVRKVKEGRADDVIPCIACQNCHGISMAKGPWYSTCTVNPTWGLPPYKLKGITRPGITKKVAVIGGGPGGMKAAMVAAERGHSVTLFEKSGSLGGLLKISDHSQWRWNYKDFKEYLIHQVDKLGVEVKLNTGATPSMIKSGGFDTVLAATGAVPVASRMKDSDAGNIFDIVSAYTNKKTLGKNVVILGAGKFGAEAGIGMAKDGHKVTVLTTARELIEPENHGPHNLENQLNIIQYHPNFSYELGVMIKDIGRGRVTYTDSSDSDKSIKADSIVIYSGLKPMMDEAEKFIGSADEVYFLGHCTGKNGSLQKTIRSAFFIASQV